MPLNVELEKGVNQFTVICTTQHTTCVCVLNFSVAVIKDHDQKILFWLKFPEG